MNSGARRLSVNFLCVCRRTWKSYRRYKLICSHHNVQLLPAGRPWTHNAEVPMVEEVFNNSADGMAFLFVDLNIKLHIYCFTVSKPT